MLNPYYKNNSNSNVYLLKINLFFLEILDRRLSFLQFVESLEQVLTSTEKDVRLKGVEAFVNVLKNLPLDFFKTEELNFINQFLCERFIDHHSFVPIVLIGIEYTVIVKIIFFNSIKA